MVFSKVRDFELLSGFSQALSNDYALNNETLSAKLT